MRRKRFGIILQEATERVKGGRGLFEGGCALQIHSRALVAAGIRRAVEVAASASERRRESAQSLNFKASGRKQACSSDPLAGARGHNANADGRIQSSEGAPVSDRRFASRRLTPHCQPRAPYLRANTNVCFCSPMNGLLENR